MTRRRGGWEGQKRRPTSKFHLPYPCPYPVEHHLHLRKQRRRSKAKVIKPRGNARWLPPWLICSVQAEMKGKGAKSWSWNWVWGLITNLQCRQLMLVQWIITSLLAAWEVELFVFCMYMHWIKEKRAFIACKNSMYIERNWQYCSKLMLPACFNALLWLLGLSAMVLRQILSWLVGFVFFWVLLN